MIQRLALPDTLAVEVSVSVEILVNVVGQVIYARQPTGHRHAFVVLQEQLVLIQQYRLV